MSFQVTAQRGDLTDVTCPGLPGLETALDDLKMSVRDAVCRTPENIVTLLSALEGPVCVGWSARYGWVYVEGRSE